MVVYLTYFLVKWFVLGKHLFIPIRLLKNNTFLKIFNQLLKFQHQEVETVYFNQSHNYKLFSTSLELSLQMNFCLHFQILYFHSFLNHYLLLVHYFLWVTYCNEYPANKYIFISIFHDQNFLIIFMKSFLMLVIVGTLSRNK